MTIKELREILENPYLDPSNEVVLGLGDDTLVRISSAMPGAKNLILDALLDKEINITEAATKYAESTGDKENALLIVKAFVSGIKWILSKNINKQP